MVDDYFSIARRYIVVLFTGFAINGLFAHAAEHDGTSGFDLEHLLPGEERVGKLSFNPTNISMMSNELLRDDDGSFNTTVYLRGNLPTKKANDGLTRFTIPLKHAKGSKWGMVGAIRVGNEGKKGYDVMFDTQSSNTLMFHKSIKYGEEGTYVYKQLFNRRNRFYDPKKSLMADSDMGPFDIKYPDGSEYAGGRVHDGVWLQARKSHFHYMPFAWVDYLNQAAADNRGGDFDGIVGLGSGGFVRGKDKGQVAMLDMLTKTNHRGKRRQMQTPLLSENPVFSFYVSKTGKSGELMFGGHNAHLLTERGEMSYFPALMMKAATYAVEDWEACDESICDDGDTLSEHGDEDGGGGHQVVITDGRGGGGQGRRRRHRVDTSSSRQARLLQGTKKNGSTDQQQHHDEVPYLDVVWGIKSEKLVIGNKEITPKVNALFCSTVPYGVAFPSSRREGGGGDGDNYYMELLVNAIGNGARMEGKDLVIPCDNRKSEELPILELVVNDAQRFSFTPEEYFPEEIIAPGNGGGKKKKGGEKNEVRMCRSFFGIVDDEPGPGKVEYDDGEGVGDDATVIRLGIPFMKKYYVEYDYYGGGGMEEDTDDTGARIGIGPSKGVEIKYRSTKKIIPVPL